MKRKFLSNLIFIVFINLLIKPVWIFLIDRGVQNSLGQIEYGSFFALFNFTYIFQIILDLGITNFNNKRIAQNPKVLNKYFSGLTRIKFALGIVYVVIAVSIGMLMDYSSTQFKILLLLCLNQFLLLFILFLRSNISGQLKFRAESFFSVMDKILMIIFCGLLLFSPSMKSYLSIETFVLAQTFSYLITAVLAWVVALKGQVKINFKFSTAFVWSTIKSSLPYATLVFLMSIYNKVGPVILERFYSNGKELTGYFAQGYRILDAYMMVSILFISLLYPLFSNLLHKKESITGILSMSLRLLLVPTIILVTISFHHSESIMNVLYHKTTSYTSISFFLLTLISLPVLVINIFGTLLTANGNLKALNYISLGAVIINILLCFILKTEKGDLSISIALLCALLFAAVCHMILVLQLFKFSKVMKPILSLLFLTISIFGLGFGFKVLDFDWITQSLAIIISGFGLAFLLKIISLKEITVWLRPVR